MRRLGLLLFAISGVLLPAGGLGCGGWRGYGSTYYARRVPARLARDEATFSFGMPGPAWRPAAGLPEVQVAWISRPIAGVIEVHVQCDEHGDSSLDQFTDHLRIDWGAWNVVEQVPLRLAGRAALRTVVVGDLDGVPRKQEFIVVKKDGCLFDLRYGARPDAFELGRDGFRRVVAGFSFPSGGAS